MEQGIKGLIARILPDHSNQINAVISRDNSTDFYEYYADNNNLVIKGNNGVSVATGLYDYLKKYCNIYLSWCGNNINIPHRLPMPKSVHHHNILQKYRAMYNYCTYGYSMPFWDWDRWEKEIDFLALNGINMPLSIIGTEGVWYYTLLDMGFSKQEALDFISNPVYFPWQLMTNFEGVNPVKTEDFILRRIELGKKIIDRQLELGMMPILQGFSGFVPRAALKHFPSAKITYTIEWARFPKTVQLDPLDPLFKRFGKAFLDHSIKLFGYHRLYAADPYHESKPPTSSRKYLHAVGRAISDLFNEYGENTVWVIQSWSLRKRIIETVDKSKLLILDIDGSKAAKSNHFWGFPFVAGRLDNFGQKTYFHGDINRTAENEFMKLKSKGVNVVGTGLFMEGSLSNPMYYEALFEMQTSDKTISRDLWLRDYCTRRYGKFNESAYNALKILFEKIYVKPIRESGTSSVICGLPMLHMVSSGQGDNEKRPYSNADMIFAFQYMLEASEELSDSYCYRYDLADMARQCVSNKALEYHREIEKVFYAKDINRFKKLRKQFIDIMLDLDTLLCNFDEMSFYRWIDDAHKMAKNDDERQWLDESARALLTVWGPYENTYIFDYAGREWAGLIREFYVPRWNIFFDMLEENFGSKKFRLERFYQKNDGKPEFRFNKFYNKLADWQIDWVKTYQEYAKPDMCDSIQQCKNIYKKIIT